MSVLQLRRNMVVEDAPSTDVVAIEKPFPLRTIDTIEAHAVVVEPDDEEDVEQGPSFLSVLRGWFNGLIAVSLLAAYPVLVVMASNVGDRQLPAVDRSEWTAPWAGAASGLLASHFDTLGWAPDAAAWEPMARLTAKPAYQRALAETTGEYVSLMQAGSAAAGREDADLEAAARLISASSTGVQLRAGRDALVSHDRRLRRTSGSAADTAAPDPAGLVAQLSLIESWGERSQAQIADTAATLGGSPVDEGATIAVYQAKGRAMSAYAFIDAMGWSDAKGAAAARAAALDAWKAAAEFRPLIVLNGSPDGSLFGNHPASMGYLIAKAQEATATYRALVADGLPRPAPPAAPAPTDTPAAN